MRAVEREFAACANPAQGAVPQSTQGCNILHRGVRMCVCTITVLGLTCTSTWIRQGKRQEKCRQGRQARPRKDLNCADNCLITLLCLAKLASTPALLPEKAPLLHGWLPTAGILVPRSLSSSTCFSRA
eukprot:scaffold223411_cov19-Tisochrysis_lutea.AAC.2